MSQPRQRTPRGAILLLFRGTALLAALLVALVARAADPSRVVIVRPPAPSQLLQEALMRARGELGAVGFEIDERAAPVAPEDLAADVYGVLAFEEIGSVVRVSATSADGEAALVQSVDTTGPGVDAEVVAVRAVETLRAAMLRFTRQADTARRSVPSPVRGFTETEPPAIAAPKPEPEPESAPALTPPASVSKERAGALTVWLGPSLLLPEPSAAVGWGAQAGLYFGRSWYFVGASLETSLVPTRYDADSGSAEVRRTFALLAFRTLVDVEDSSVVSAAAGLGFASTSLQGRAEEGFDANQENHESAAVALELGTATWILDHLGVYLAVRGSFALDAPVIRIDGRAIGTLDRPALSLSAGVVVGRR